MESKCWINHTPPVNLKMQFGRPVASLKLHKKWRGDYCETYNIALDINARMEVCTFCRNSYNIDHAVIIPSMTTGPNDLKMNPWLSVSRGYCVEDEKVDSSPCTLWQEEQTGRQPVANSVHSSLSLTPVQNKNHDAAQVWDHNCGRLDLQNPMGWHPPVNTKYRQLLHIILVIHC